MGNNTSRAAVERVYNESENVVLNLMPGSNVPNNNEPGVQDVEVDEEIAGQLDGLRDQMDCIMTNLRSKNLTPNNAIQTFLSYGKRLLENKAVTLGLLVILFFLAAAIAWVIWSLYSAAFVASLKVFVRQVALFICQNIGEWIAANGGWIGVFAEIFDIYNLTAPGIAVLAAMRSSIVTS